MRALLALLLLAGCNSAGPSTSPADPGPDVPAPTEAPAAPDEPEADQPDFAALPDLVHDAANDARRENGASVLTWSDELAALAEAHSRDMATRGYFDHVSPEGTDPQQRATAAGITCRLELGGGRARVGVAENLYQSTAYRRVRTSTRGGVTTRTVDWFSPEALAEATVDGWLTSPGHRRNLLDDDARSQGIGVALADETVYVTQVLC